MTSAAQSTSNSQDQQTINVLKGLVIDGVNKANSGHPGGPLSSMDLTYLLFTEFLRFDPEDKDWLGRDRFILSAGHMSMLQYAMLYGIGWLKLDDLKSFRQLHSKTPGHPENFMTPGVECTTGPLGQGAAMSVGFAIAASHCAAKLDKTLFNYKTWAVVSDGDLQEGVALGSASLAGHLKLGNLVWVYDKNFIQLSGPTNQTTSDEEEQIYRGFGWQVLTIDGHDHEAIRKAYKQAQATSDRPTLIVARTVIGKGLASMEASHKTHGSPLPADERTKSKAKLGLPADQDFYAPDSAIQHFRRNFAARREEVKSWKQSFTKKLEGDQDFATNFRAYFEAPKDRYEKLSNVEWSDGKPVATRNAFGDIIEKWAHEIPNLIGGSADLEPSNMTGAFAKQVGSFSATNRLGRNFNFGVREFPMSAICNGMALHGGLVPFDATFLSFADYSRGALRLGAIQKCRVIHEFTHDSFHLGEDGPTHQPVEQVMSLRTIPDFYVMRPADAVETEVLMRKALAMKLPTAFCLTRQKLPQIKLPRSKVADAVKGAYAVREEAQPTMLLIATGSEVSLAMDVATTLVAQGERVRVISMPCWELFAEQPESYRQALIPPTCTKRVTIEAGTTLGWERYAGDRGLIIGLDHFGASAPAEVLAEQYGFTPEAICAKIAKHRFS